MTDTEPSAKRSLTSNALLTAVSQSAVMIGGGINAALIGSRYPASGDTDSLFAAFGIYSMVVIVSASARTALVPRLIDSEIPYRPFNSFLGATLWNIPLIGFVFALIATPLINYVVDGDTGDLVLVALLLLWPAAIGQFLAALGAAMLGVLGDFLYPSIAYFAGGIISVFGFLIFEPIFGLKALPVAILIATSSMVAIIAWALVRAGWRPEGLSPSFANAWRWNKILAMGASIYVSVQGLYLITISIASMQIGPGAATFYTYAFFGVGLASALITSAGSFVLAAPIAADWTGDSADLEPIEDDVGRIGFMLCGFTGGAAALIASDVMAPILTSFSNNDIHEITSVILALLPTLISGQILVVPLIALFTLGRLGFVALLSVGVVLLHTVLTVGLGQSESLIAIALATSISNLALSIAILASVHKDRTTDRLLHVGRHAVMVLAPMAAIYFAAAESMNIIGFSGPKGSFTAFSIGTIASGAFVWYANSDYRQLIRRLLGSIRPAGA